MKQKIITIEEYIDSLIINNLKSAYSKYENFTQQDFEDVMQETKLFLLNKKDKNTNVNETISYIEDNLNKKDRFSNTEFKKSCNYLNTIIRNAISNLLIKQLWIKSPKYIKNEDSWKWELQKREEWDIYKANFVWMDWDWVDEEYYEQTLNTNIDLNMFYVELQKYANILLCLMSEKDIKDIKELEDSNPRTKLKFLMMFKEFIINIDKEVKWFDNEQIKDFWIFVLKSIKKDKELDKRFINTKIFKTFKDIYY